MKKLIMLIYLFASVANATNCEFLGDELIQNGSFDNDFSGFYTKYVFINSPPMSYTGECAVTNDPSSFFSGWLTFDDKSPSINGKMFLADASINTSLVLIGTNVTINQNTYYKFSLWVARVNNAGPPVIKVSINDQQQISKQINQSQGIWVNLEFEWFSNNYNNAKIEIFNTNSAQYGNDFVIDEISLRPCSKLDFFAPKISTNEKCYQIDGLIYDSTLSDTGIMTYLSPNGSKINCSVNFGNISANARTVGFVAQLSDIRFDGSFIIEATDSASQTISKTFDIKGFTVGINGSETSTNPQSFNELIPPDSTKCFKILLHNYGKFVQNIKTYIISNPTKFKVLTPFPLKINPGEVVPIEICFNSKEEDIYIDSLILVSDCNDLKNFANFKISTKLDKYPQISAIEDCYKISGIISDSAKNDSGIMTYLSPDSSKINCSVNFGNISANARTVGFVAQLSDIRFDGSFIIEATDSASQTISKTFDIKGFTVGINGSETSTNPQSFNELIPPDSTKCFKILLHNYGKFVQNIKTYIISNPTNFKVLTPFPMAIKPGEVVPVEICFNSKDDNLYIDSLILVSDCNDLKNLVEFKISTKLDKYPQITYNEECYKTSGFIYDSTKSDTGIMIYQSPDSSKINCTVSFGSIANDRKKVDFISQLNDKRFDGKFSVIAIDSSNLTSVKDFEIKGFTIGINGDEYSNNSIKFEDSLHTGNSKCYNIPIHNYGKFIQTLNSYSIKNSVNFTVNTQFPMQINPGEIENIEICFNTDSDSLFLDSFAIINDCGDLKNFADFKIITGQDKYPPRITKSSDSCIKEFTIFVIDSASWDSGISEILVEDSINCMIQIAARTQNSAKIYIKVIEFKKDMYFSLSIIDSNGNKIVISDTIVYKEVKVSGIDSIFPNQKHFNEINFNTISKDSIIIHNLYNTPLTLYNLYLKQNINFSINPSQFPLKINPKDSATLYITFKANRLYPYEYKDTLIIDSYCINQEIILTGYGKSIEDTTNSKCQIKLVLNTLSPPTDLIINNIYPNPALESATLIFENNIQSKVQIDLFSSTGELVDNYLNSELMVGKFETSLAFKNLSGGLYILRISNGFQSSIKPIIINK